MGKNPYVCESAEQVVAALVRCENRGRCSACTSTVRFYADHVAAERERVIVAWLEDMIESYIDTPEEEVTVFPCSFMRLLLEQARGQQYLRALEAGELAEYLEVDGG